MILKLNGLEVDCIIGDLPQERTGEQRLTVNVEMEIADDSAVSDELEDTVDYAWLKTSIVEALREAKCKLIERAAKVVGDECMRQRAVRRARVSVKKAGILPGLGSAEAMIELTRRQ